MISSLGKGIILIGGLSLMLIVGSLVHQPLASSRDGVRAIAVLHPVSGSKVMGTVTFVPTGNALSIKANISGLSPGEHGFHIHQWGDCSDEDGTSAGGHFNPENSPHAGPMVGTRHIGDMGNISADTKGIASDERIDKKMTLIGPESVIGRAVILHSGRDDLKSQPSGNAGPRVACGVIGYSQP